MHNEAITLLEKTAKTRLRTLRNQAKLCRKQFSEEAVHDLRVAMRRLLALLDFLRFFVASPAVRKVRRSLKSHLDAFDALRDTQVMLLETGQRLSELPQIEPFHRYLQKNEKRLLRRAQKDIEDVDTTYTKPIRAALKALQSVSADVLSPVDDAYQTVLQRLSMVEAENAGTIHRVRIAFKRFRYSFEIVQPVLPDVPQDLPAQMHDYQTYMGEIQDVEVLLRALEEFASRAQKDGADLTAVREFYEQLHRQRVERYLQNMDKVYSFWRPAPEAPFGWQEGRLDVSVPVQELAEAVDEAQHEASAAEQLVATDDASLEEEVFTETSPSADRTADEKGEEAQEAVEPSTPPAEEKEVAS